MSLEERKVLGWKAWLREQFRLIRLSLYFSLLSAFSMGWRELNVSTWIIRLQKRDYMLKGSGWVRVLSGSQSLISAYLIPCNTIG